MQPGVSDVIFVRVVRKVKRIFQATTVQFYRFPYDRSLRSNFRFTTFRTEVLPQYSFSDFETTAINISRCLLPQIISESSRMSLHAHLSCGSRDITWTPVKWSLEVRCLFQLWIFNIFTDSCSLNRTRRRLSSLSDNSQRDNPPVVF